MNDSEMLNWLEEHGESFHLLEVNDVCAFMLVYIDGEKSFKVLGEGLRDCILGAVNQAKSGG